MCDHILAKHLLAIARFLSIPVLETLTLPGCGGGLVRRTLFCHSVPLLRRIERQSKRSLVPQEREHDFGTLKRRVSGSCVAMQNLSMWYHFPSAPPPPCVSTLRMFLARRISLKFSHSSCRTGAKILPLPLENLGIGTHRSFLLSRSCTSVTASNRRFHFSTLI